MCEHAHMSADAWASPEWVLKTLELEQQVLVSRSTWVLGTKPASSIRATLTLNLQAVSPASVALLLHRFFCLSDQNALPSCVHTPGPLLIFSYHNA